MPNKRKLDLSNHENMETRNVKTRSKLCEEEEEDRLSDLPEHIISKIMSFLPLEEAIGTCILSRRWKDVVFCSMSDINLHCSHTTKGLQIKFINFVDRYLLLRKNTGVDRFSFDGKLRAVEAFRISTWILYAVLHGVRDLDLRVDNLDFTHVQSSVFTCKTLEKLTLHSRIFKPSTLPPISCCLPNLKLLSLDFPMKSKPGNEIITRLLSSCNSLEELKLCCSSSGRKLSVCNPKLKRLTIRNFFGRELKINTPNLLYFCYYYQSSLVKKHSFINLKSLSEARVFIGAVVLTAPLISVMKAIRHVQSLQLSGYNPNAIRGGFPKLTYLKMRGCFSGWEKMLCASRYLQTLTFDFLSNDLPVDGVIPKEDFPCPMHNIKAIKLFSFKREHVDFLEYLLKGAIGLESLSVFRAKRPLAKSKRMMVREIRAFVLPKVSKICKLVIR